MRRATTIIGLILLCLLSSSWRQTIGHMDVATNTGSGSDPCSAVSTGQACSGTAALKLGSFNGYKYMITPSGCTDSSTPTCAGGTDTVLKFWEGLPGSTPSTVDILTIPNVAGAEYRSAQLGDAGTPGMTGAASVGPSSAAHYCEAMSYGGYTDWYLPSKTEMAYIYCKAQPTATHNTSFPEEDPNCVNFGGKTSSLTGFQNDQYWTSTEEDGSYAWRQYVGNGTQFTSIKNNEYGVRCIRRYDTTLGTAAPNLVQLNLIPLAAATLHTVSMPMNTTVGNTIIIAAAGRASTHTITTITGCGATFVQRARIGATNCEAEIWSGVCTSASSSFTIASNVALLRVFEVMEWSGLTGGFDGADSGTNQNSFTNSTTGFTTTNAKTVIVAAGSMDKHGAGGAPNNQFLYGGYAQGGSGGNLVTGFFAYKAVMSTGTYNTSWALSGTGSPNSCMIQAAIY